MTISGEVNINGSWKICTPNMVCRNTPRMKRRFLKSKPGPIVRISPRELHIDDPDFYDHLFGSTLRLDKDPWTAGQFGQTLSTQATASASLHRLRRAALSPFFSQAKVTQLQGCITNKIEKLCGIMSQHQASGNPANMHNLYRALTVEIITEYAFAESWNTLDKLDEGVQWFDMIKGSSEGAAFVRQFGWVTQLMKKLPPWLAIKIAPDLKGAFFIFSVSLTVRGYPFVTLIERHISGQGFIDEQFIS